MEISIATRAHQGRLQALRSVLAPLLSNRFSALRYISFGTVSSSHTRRVTFYFLLLVSTSSPPIPHVWKKSAGRMN